MSKPPTMRLTRHRPVIQDVPKARTAEAIQLINAMRKAYGKTIMVKTNQSKRAKSLPGIPDFVEVEGVVVYSYNLNVPERKQAYEELVAELKAKKYHLHRSLPGKMTHWDWGTKVKKVYTGPILMDFTHPHADQWSTAGPENLHVHEWAEDAAHGGPMGTPTHMRNGYYLKGIEKLKAELAKLSSCGYCGNFGLVAEEGFCRACVGSSYLKEADLNLLVMRPVGEKWMKTRPASYQSAVAKYLPDIKAAWLNAQLHDMTSSILDPKAASKKAEEIAGLRRRAAKFEQAALAWEWLYARNINTENIIYYDSANIFQIGWRSMEGLDKEIADKWRELLKDFPADYKIKEVGVKD